MKFILVLLLGALLGGVGAYFLFVGAPRTSALKGSVVRPPEPGAPPAGTAVVELDEQFFVTVLDSIFRDLERPAFPPQAGEGCQNRVFIEPNAGDVRTSVLMRDGRVIVPLAFSGTYNLMGCQNLRGKAEAGIDFRFAAEEQALYGDLNVAGVDLEGMSPLLSGLVTAFVQGAINQHQRENPLVLMRGQPLTLAIPVQAAGGTLNARARDVRGEAKDGKLRLYVTYDFKGTKGGT